MRSDRDGQTHYYRVVSPFAVEVLVGHKPSNVWLGRSQVIGVVYETVMLRPGDELHCLPGGDFLVRDGEAFDFATRRGEASDLLLHPAPADPPLSKDKLRELPAGAAHKPASYHHELSSSSWRTVPK
jgi:hypothetical protein